MLGQRLLVNESGTFNSEHVGLVASGSSLTLRLHSMWRFAEARIVASWASVLAVTVDTSRARDRGSCLRKPVAPRAWCLPSNPLKAEPRPDERPSVLLSRSFIADAASAAAPAVVNIQARLAGAMGLVGGGVTGSGFIIDKSGLLMTNAHVVQPAAQGEVIVRLWDGRDVKGRVHSTDSKSDIALVQIESRPPKDGFPAASIGTSSRLRAGDFVVALGSPLNLGRTVTAGIVSSTARQASEIGILDSRLDYIQTDAAINQGNSGGPLVNLDGEVVGVCTMKAGNSDGIAFAVPIDAAWPVVKALLKNKKVVRPYVGIKMRTDLSRGAVMVEAVRPNSPGEAAGILIGDRIVSVDGHPVNTIRDVLNRTGVSPGQRILVSIESPDGSRGEVVLVTAPES